MKRSYPYSATGSSQGAASATPPAGPQPPADYSAYGYGNTASTGSAASAGMSNDVQQAQWHQQWQQYYAQQAAAAGTAQSSHAGSPGMSSRPAAATSAAAAAATGGPPAGPAMNSQPYGYAGAGQFPGQQHAITQQAPYVHQAYVPQQQQQQQHASPPASYNSGWSGAVNTGGLGYANPPMATPGQPYTQPYGSHMQPPPPQHQQQQGPPFGGGAYSQHYYGPGPANKRARMDDGYGNPNPPYPHASGAHMASPQSHHSAPSHPRQQRSTSGSASARQSVSHPIPGRPQVAPHAGGPSNMAGPMASAVPPRSAGVPPRPAGANSRGTRGPRNSRIQQQQGNTNASGGGSGKFNGPQGVNAVLPASGSNRSAFGQQQLNHGARRGNGLSSGRASSQAVGGSNNNNKTGRSQQDSARNKGIGAIPKGPAAARTAVESGLEMDKAPLMQGRTSTPVDQPVPVTAKKTFTDFRFNLIEIDPIQWQWRPEEEIDNEIRDAEADATPGEESTSLQDECETTVDSAAGVNNSLAGQEKSADKNTASNTRRRSDSQKDVPRVRISFAANPPPANAPSGPKALMKTAEAKIQTASGEDNKSAVEENEESNDTARNAEVIDKAEGATVSSQDWTAFSRGPPQISTNRVTITYASMKRRLVIDSEVVKTIDINRAKGLLRIVVDVKTAAGMKRRDQLDKKRGEEWVVARGVLLEARNNETENFMAVPRRELESCWREQRTCSKAGDVDDDSKVASGKVTEGEEIVGEEKEGDVSMKEAAGQADEKTHAQKGSKEVQMGTGPLDAQDKAMADGSKDQDDLADQKDVESAGGDGVLVADDFQSLPPFYRLLSQHEGPEADADNAAQNVTEMTITLSLDSATQQAKWLRTGDVEEWLTALPGMQASLGADPLRTWVSKLHVVDPDPPPTYSEVLAEWVKHSFVGTAVQRRELVQDSHLATSSTGLIEVFARLVNVQERNAGGMERLPSLSTSASTPPMKELGAPLQESLSKSIFGAHQSHLSLSVLALARMACDFAAAAAIPEEELASRLQELLLCVPMKLLYSSLDGLCKESLDKQRIAQAKSRRTNANGRRSLERAIVNGRSIGVSATIENEASGAEGQGDASAGPSSREASMPSAAQDEASVQTVEDSAKEGPSDVDDGRKTQTAKKEQEVGDAAERDFVNSVMPVAIDGGASGTDAPTEEDSSRLVKTEEAGAGEGAIVDVKKEHASEENLARL